MDAGILQQVNAVGMQPLAWALAALLAVALGFAVRKLLRVIGHLPLARLGWRGRRAPREYVRALFDGYAGHYDRHLLVDLDYQAANRVSSALGDHLASGAAPPGRALDLGCGTGLLGVLIAPRVGYLAGVDLSPKMLRGAARRRVYDELFQADVVDFLRRPQQAYDLVTAADMLVYLGELGTLMEAIVSRLNPGGVFICTTEYQPEPGYRLRRTGRFAHHPAYLRDVARAAGMVVVSQAEVVLRTQRDAPVVGHVHVLAKGFVPQ